ncbi:MAG: ribonucleotide-diphosphate reductase subunit beta [Acidimicrobiales bacterium]|nr:ribonucleotide-diphosphate reductase subunit beta [Acidimicrobiales bacterium]
MALTDALRDTDLTATAGSSAPAPAPAPTPGGAGDPGGRRAILDPGLDLTLRPMRYPGFYERYRDAIRNTWTVEEVDFSDDIVDLQRKLLPAERHLVNRLVAFFATGDSIVSNNLVLNLYKHINAPEARLYLSRQLFEEALHVQFYLTLLDTYIPDHDERHEAFAAIENVPAIREKAEFCFRWIDSVNHLDRLATRDDRRQFLLNLICFAACIEGLFFYAAFAYVYFMRSKGLLNGLASGTNWVFRDESAHMGFAFEVVDTVRREEPDLFDGELAAQVTRMLEEAVDVETRFAEDLLGEGVPGLSTADMRQYLEFVADQRLGNLGMARRFGAKNPFAFMELQDVQELTNFFERTVAAYQIGVTGEVSFDEDF